MYQTLIREFTGCKQGEAEEIEEMMRLMYRGILSDISRDRFRRDARRCYKEMQQAAMTSFDPGETN